MRKNHLQQKAQPQPRIVRSGADATVAEHWSSARHARNRAEELRTKAKRAGNEQARTSLLKLAEEFEQLANFHEEFVAAKALNAGAQGRY